MRRECERERVFMGGCSQLEGALEEHGRGGEERLVERLGLGCSVESLRSPCVQQPFKLNGDGVQAWR
jgi:hypothetical protein